MDNGAIAPTRAQKLFDEQLRDSQLTKLAVTYVQLAEDEWRHRVKTRDRPGDRDLKRALHLAKKSAFSTRAMLFRMAGWNIRDKTPGLYLRHVLWRVAAAEERARRETRNTPLVTSMPATMLVSLGVDITPDTAWELTRKNASASIALLSAVESQFDDQ
jgi:hypothetical protein